MESTSVAQVLPLSPSVRGVRSSYSPDGRRRIQDGVLRDASRVFYSIWENSSEGMRLTDENGIIVAVNQAFCRLVGKSEDDVVGKHFTVIYAPEEDIDQLSRSYEIKFKSGNIRTRFEKTYRLWSDKTLEVEVISSFVEAEEGRPFMLAQFHDVSEQRLMQRALIDSESKYRRLFANSVQPMFESTLDGHIVNANRALLRLLGYENMLELVDLDIERDLYVNTEDRMLMIEAMKARGYLMNMELQLRRKNGKVITVIEHSRAVVDSSGQLIGFEGILEDVTARKAMEHKLQQYLQALEETKKALGDLNAEKDKLFSILSHDLRSPFGSILGFSEILLNDAEEVSEEERKEFLRYIREAAQDQLALVDKLLDWSRLETGRIKMERKEVGLADVIKGSIISLAGLARQRSVTLSSTVPDGVIVRGDEQLLQQVFTNLVGNALKFTPAGGSIQLALKPPQDRQWVVTVTDTGVGIPAEDIPKLFRVEEKYTRKGLNGEKGTGLGLPVVFEIMQKHDGSIRVESQPGSGTTFFLQFPDARPQGEVPVVIVADDEAGVRVLHSRYVRRLFPNASVIQASNGREVCDLARTHRPALILSDYDMPVMDGFDMTKELKKDAATKTIPVVIITGQDSHASHEALVLSGASEVIRKPVMLEHLAGVLRKLELPTLTLVEEKAAV